MLSFFLAPWVPTPKKDLERINRLADLKSGDVFYEIGCGTAIVSTFIARKNPEVRVVGIELVFPLYLFAEIKRLVFGPKNLSIKFGDAFSKSYTDADVVYVYGLPRMVNGKLKEKIEDEFKSGARLVSLAFVVDNWKGKCSFTDKPTPKDVSVNVYIK